MKKTTTLFVSMICAATIISLASCKKDATTPGASESTTSLTVSFSNAAPYTFFSLKNGSVIPNIDSSTNKWDFGLRRTSFIFNSHAFGLGNAGVIVADGIYADITEAPTTGYAYDTTTSKLAVPSYKLWADYNPATYSFVPKAGKTFIIRTAEGMYAKMELLQTIYEPFVGPVPSLITYKLRYTIQANGSTKF
ncbi:HmuY family protein [Ferruginibacter sp. SUN002]|uniref:HmuY family protein n=1 Tax=Ferruginibacter sp. SUN002 TaxID=2937789 RepID=UPI003D359C9D